MASGRWASTQHPSECKSPPRFRNQEDGLGNIVFKITETFTNKLLEGWDSFLLCYALQALWGALKHVLLSNLGRKQLALKKKMEGTVML